MHLLFLDETNKEPTERIRFFLYGGLFIPADKVGTIHSEIEGARIRYGYAPLDRVKFDTNVRPKTVSQENCTKLKQEIIELCYRNGCKFSVLVLHHKIASKQNPEAKFLWSSAGIIGHFNYFLSKEVNDYGLVLVDRLPIKSPENHLEDIFTHGLDIDGKRQKLDRIAGLGSVSIGASHLSSAIDVILGTFRFCVNNLSEDPKIKSMLCSVARMLWHKEINGVKYVRERGLLIRPKEIKVQSYKNDYDDLVMKMESLIKEI